MSNPPDFLKMRCRNTDMSTCQVCNKEFLIPVNAIEMISKDGDKAIILLKNTNFVPDPSCPMVDVDKRFIKTTMNWNDLLNMLDGNIANIGDIKLTYYDNLAMVK